MASPIPLLAPVITTTLSLIPGHNDLRYLGYGTVGLPMHRLFHAPPRSLRSAGYERWCSREEPDRDQGIKDHAVAERRCPPYEGARSDCPTGGDMRKVPGGMHQPRRKPMYRCDRRPEINNRGVAKGGIKQLPYPESTV